MLKWFVFVLHTVAAVLVTLSGTAHVFMEDNFVNQTHVSRLYVESNAGRTYVVSNMTPSADLSHGGRLAGGCKTKNIACDVCLQSRYPKS